MSHHFECHEHGIATTVVPGYRDDLNVDDIIAEHERLHEAELAEKQRATRRSNPNRWTVYLDDDGWWVAKRGEWSIQCLTHTAALAAINVVTLADLAGDEWAIVRYGNGTVTLQQHGDPLTKQFPGMTGTIQAIAFLKGAHADRARRQELADARDRAAAELDVIRDHLVREQAGAAKAARR